MTRYAVAPPDELVSLSISVAARESVGTRFRNVLSAQGSVAWGTANLGIWVPFRIPTGNVFSSARAWLLNGTTANGNVDIGIYDESFARLASTGAVAQSGVGALQDLAALSASLAPGRYYLAISLSSATGTVFSTSVAAAYGAAAGCFQQAAAHPLPATATPALYAQTFVPVFGISSRSVL